MWVQLAGQYIARRSTRWKDSPKLWPLRLLPMGFESIPLRQHSSKPSLPDLCSRTNAFENRCSPRFQPAAWDGRKTAPAVVFLCTDAAALITGSSVKVDGGWTAQ